MTTQEIEKLKLIIENELIIGRISRMDAINNKSVFDASLRNTHTRIKALQEALKIIQEPDFGRCIKCHSAIALERLKIRPEIRKCCPVFRAMTNYKSLNSLLAGMST